MTFVSKQQFHKNFLKSEVFQFRIGELATMTGVSSLSRDGEQDARVYNYKTYVAVATIKNFLDEGYTLKAAVKKKEELEQSWKVLHDVMSRAVQGTAEIDGIPAVDLGFFDAEQTQRLFATVDDQNVVKYRVQTIEE